MDKLAIAILSKIKLFNHCTPLSFGSRKYLNFGTDNNLRIIVF